MSICLLTTEEDADRFFKRRYSDTDRIAVYTKLEGLPEPKAPVVKFELTGMNRVEFDMKLKGQRVGATSHPLVQTEYPMWCIRDARGLHS